MGTLGHMPERRAGFGARPFPRLPIGFVAGAMLLIVIAGAAGWALRALAADETATPAPTTRTAAAGSVSVSVPATWSPVPAAELRIDGLGPDAAAFTPVSGLSARALIALAPFTDPSLVPESLRALAGESRPRRARVAGMRAWTYPAGEFADGRIAQLTVVPTTVGSLTVVCIAPAAVWSGAAGCSRRLTGAALGGADPLIPSPTLAFRRELAPVMERLNARRGELRAAMRGAATRRGQARFASRLRRVHLRAMTALAVTASTDGPPRRVLRELRRTARSYGRLAVAARSGWPGRYRQARLAIRRSDRALAAAVEAVR